jgi:asparagine synthase (glutamine-hydrolysing)
MCGIVGFLRHAGSSAAVDEGTIEALTETLIHRGPDDRGVWVDAEAGIAFGHRRLSVLDLSRAGHQPMKSATGRYVLIFNGEIYNHLEIRDELAYGQSAPAWRGHSDSETLLAGFERWGVEPVLKKAVGMFAFGLWDRQERTLTLARDRIGEKPLYYGWQRGVFLFGSEVKALRRHPAFRAEIDRDVLAIYMCRGYTVAPYSIYKEIFKLLPGTYLQLSATEVPGTLPNPQTYWSLREIAERGLAHPFAGTDDEACEHLEVALKKAVSLQSVADVPLGAFLSGGIDSSTILALMQVQSSRPVKTFTIGFDEADYQEANHARLVAQHLRSDHTELHVTPREAMEVIPRLPELYDEPFGDSSAIPTFLVSQLARRQVTVSLSGDGGDELFGGYRRYQRTDDIWRVMSRIPSSARSALSRGVRAASRCGRGSVLAWKANRLAFYLSSANAEECYHAQVLPPRGHELVMGNKGGLPSGDIAPERAFVGGQPYDTMMYADAMVYLPDDILVKIDRAAMSVSLETRVPMLDHRVLEFAWRLPLHMKVRNREGKWLLKQVLRKYVPASLIERPKMGFGIPVGQWIRGPLRDWAEDLISRDRIQHDGYLKPGPIRELWSRHVDGSSAEGDRVWQVLMFQAWLAAPGSSRALLGCPASPRP